MIRYTCLDTPIGSLTVAESDEGLVAVRFEGQAPPPDDWKRVSELESDADSQLLRYFDGELTAFDLPLAPKGTEFQSRVWREVEAIPYGATRSYLEVAERLGDAAAVRAVGAANGRNPLPIVIPCHRVLGVKGELTGYAGGVARKRFLLALEQPHAFGLGPLFQSATD